MPGVTLLPSDVPRDGSRPALDPSDQAVDVTVEILEEIDGDDIDGTGGDGPNFDHRVITDDTTGRLDDEVGWHLLRSSRSCLPQLALLLVHC